MSGLFRMSKSSVNGMRLIVSLSIVLAAAIKHLDRVCCAVALLLWLLIVPASQASD